jgi:hypothetical protein
MCVYNLSAASAHKAPRSTSAYLTVPACLPAPSPVGAPAPAACRVPADRACRQQRADSHCPDTTQPLHRNPSGMQGRQPELSSKVVRKARR